MRDPETAERAQTDEDAAYGEEEGEGEGAEDGVSGNDVAAAGAELGEVGVAWLAKGAAAAIGATAGIAIAA